MASTDPSFISDCLAQFVGFDYPDKCRLLSQLSPVLRLEQAVRLLGRELEMLSIEMEILIIFYSSNNSKHNNKSIIKLKLNFKLQISNSFATNTN